MNAWRRLGPTENAIAEIVPLDAIPSTWDPAWIDLAKHASEPNPFAECWFMRASIRHLSTCEDNRIIAVWLGHQLLGLLPVTPARHYGRLRVQHLQNWVHYHCFYGGPLVRAGAEAIFWGAVLILLDTQLRRANFLHLIGMDPDGPVFAALCKVRRADIVHRSSRAMLKSDLNAERYLATHVRSKKRKELRRLRLRLEELGSVKFESLQPDAKIDPWIGAFLTLEASGWKGREGTALGGTEVTKAFFTEVMAGAHRAGQLEMLQLTVDDKIIAMLVNFMTPPGSFAFKIAFDEDYARFSPGVMLKVENLKILARTDIAWMDSCAVEDHAMINSLWGERREIVRVTVPLAGARRQMIFRGARLIEKTAASLRKRR